MSEVYFKEVNAIKGPILSMMKKEGFQAVDMHYHSCASVDGLATFNQIIKRCQKDSIGVAFTDHNHIETSLKAIKRIKKDVFTIPGLEVTCHNGVHMLLHFSDPKEYQEFYQKEMKKRLKVNPWFIDLDHRQVVDVASKYNCLITAPHPYGPGFCGIKKFKTSSATIKKINAIEVLNGCLIGNMNKDAIKWAKKINKGFTGGSDGHCIAELGNSLTICRAETREEFLEQIRKKKSVVIGKEERILEDALNAVHKFIREEKKTPKKQIEKMWIDRGLLEWNYFKDKIKNSSLFCHFHAHHQHPKAKHLEQHKHTKHLVHHMKKLKKSK
jgi:predicted metal-dependent phosphoesterase TrpH